MGGKPDALSVGQVHDRSPEQRASLEVEGRVHAVEAIDHLARAVDGATEIDRLEPGLTAVRTDLSGEPLVGPLEHQSERVVAVLQRRERSTQRALLDRSAGLQQHRLVEVMQLALVLTKEPALRGGEADRAFTVRADCRLAPGLRGPQQRRQPGDRRMLEHVADPQHPAMGAHAACELDRLDRIAAKREVVVVDADLGAPQHTAQQLHEQRLFRRSRGRDCRAAGGDVLRRGQGAAIDLVAGVERQLIEEDDACRDHVVGKRETQAFSHGGDVEIRRRGDVGDQLECAGASPARDHGGFAHALVGPDRRLDFARLHTIAADLDLRIQPPEDLERPVGDQRPRSPVR